MPNALSVGVPYELFWHLTPRKLEAFHKADEIKTRKQDLLNYMLGGYVMDAMQATVCNHSFWRGKNGEPYKYPDKPRLSEVGLSDEEKKTIEEREKQMAVDKFFAEQKAMRVNFRKNKDKKGSE